MYDPATLSDDACDALIKIFLKAKPACAVDLIDVTAAEPMPDPTQGRFKGSVKSWWPEKGYGFLECEATFEVYQCDIYINRLAIGLFQKGDEVIFSVELNKEGKPQGKNLLPVSIEAKKRQLKAACDPDFDLDAYLKEHKLGPYAEAREDRRRDGNNWYNFGNGGGGGWGDKMKGDSRGLNGPKGGHYNNASNSNQSWHHGPPGGPGIDPNNHFGGPGSYRPHSWSRPREYGKGSSSGPYGPPGGGGGPHGINYHGHGVPTVTGVPGPDAWSAAAAVASGPGGPGKGVGPGGPGTGPGISNGVIDFLTAANNGTVQASDIFGNQNHKNNNKGRGKFGKFKC